ncbi:NAD-dependent protein deacetylase SRT1 isoform X1 [Physcomitrium patens]|uniref:protein acetyllysine N-acetyltransferase n=1 Tax=Physcomitrium patens TaxID=3218 RepID=A0A2K1KVV0_PHYPA|nr:NAD-dependent protein deacetylase SRT1-like isoform X1 [Physcomitrium patens]PNR57898.1 hypothetical protein PHYPA_004892 [Physcomitrium patens]|eukprot:XP_024369668.1 NAD-dependent protein deacetylase SRT1-like isoform X1 [Physcomitrella patens]
MSQTENGARRRSNRRGVGREMEDEEEGPVLRAKVKHLAQLVRESKYAVVYTGAGISTAAGIPDFRGPSGVWTLQAKGKVVAEPDFTKLNPTLTHYVLRSFIERGHFHYIVTQNIDSLHLRSGVPSEKQSELHGNYSLETCPLCDARYFRSHAVWKGLTTPTKNPSTARKDLRQGSTQGDDKPQRSNKRQVRNIDHRTGRLCEADGCAGELESSVVLFGESLPAKEVNSAWDHTYKADLALVLGSSLKVGPACDMPAQVGKNGGKLVIVNLQHTPFDGRASLVIHARCDDVLRLLAEELDLSEQNPSLVSSNRALEHDVGVHEDMSSECYDQKLEEFERSFMVQTTSFAPRT